MLTLITGGGGFIGSHLATYLFDETEDDILLLDDFSTGNPENVSHLIDHDRVELIQGDVIETGTIEPLVERSDRVFHLAAAVGVQRIVDEPLRSMRTNLVGTENVLEAAVDDRTPVFIASSSELYGKSEDVPFAESDDRVLGPTSSLRWSYASAKAIDESLALAYHRDHDLPVAIGRYFNIVGPRQTGQYGMVIPRFVEQALANEPLTVYGDGTQTRSFTHVADAVRATYELLTTPEAHGEVINIGAPDPTSINALAERIIELTGSDSDITHIPYEEAYNENFEEPQQREPDVSKLEATLGWYPSTDLDRILLDIIEEREQAVVPE
ncbi:GDP-mannose 4,6-dehydratase [Halolamina salifodinae]|uniref:UDP-glucuronate decarboxylase n=1 Tax=Halolamina salifodinae TaxID=1202767 RepID=A0A8T4GZR2_9EURY|nr:GDP-mannose 4,6-dehydratase [Halolamina salifodinae]MBP1987792.1 UDP-glucose 4-epimerase [Halolamina salifodinae]